MMEYHKMNKISGAPADVTLVCSQLSCQDPQVSLDGVGTSKVKRQTFPEQPGRLYQVRGPDHLLCPPGRGGSTGRPGPPLSPGRREAGWCVSAR